MAKKVKMSADDEKKFKYIDAMAQKISLAILETMEQHENYDKMSLAEGTTILVVAVCHLFQAMADVTKNDVNKYLDLFVEGVNTWKENP
jgi:hypothetical protein